MRPSKPGVCVSLDVSTMDVELANGKPTSYNVLASPQHGKRQGLNARPIALRTRRESSSAPSTSAFQADSHPCQARKPDVR